MIGVPTQEDGFDHEAESTYDAPKPSLFFFISTVTHFGTGRVFSG